MGLAGDLRAIVGDAHVLVDPPLRAPYETDWTGRFSGAAALVVRPGDAEQVAAVLAACSAAGAPVVPQGGNTGLVGGGVPRGGEVVLSLTRLDDLGMVDTAAARVTVGAGAALGAVQAHAAAAGMLVGVDLAARDSATIGGMVATNAGGIRVLAYGSMRANVLGVEAVTADGRVVRRLAGLTKDNTGYDLAGLLAGSEGTLAVITRVVLRLHPTPAHTVTAMLGVADTAAALDVLSVLRRRLRDLTAVEICYPEGVAIVLERTTAADPLPGHDGVYLLVECAGATDPTEAMAAALDELAVEDVAVGVEPGDRRRLWELREGHSEALAAGGDPPVKLDVSVPLARLGELVERLPAVVHGAVADARAICFGHLAEGNLHVNVVGVGRDPERVAAIEDAVLRLVAALGGSISAEHGIGVAKTPWLALTRDDTDRALLRAIKAAFDPEGLLNPGVIFGR